MVKATRESIDILVSFFPFRGVPFSRCPFKENRRIKMINPCENECTISYRGCEKNCFARKVYRAYLKGKRQERIRQTTQHEEDSAYYNTVIDALKELKEISSAINEKRF